MFQHIRLHIFTEKKPCEAHPAPQDFSIMGSGWGFRLPPVALTYSCALPRNAAPIIPASFPSFAITISVFLAESRV